MQRRFESDPLFQATLLLLQERVPRVAAPSTCSRRSRRPRADASGPSLADPRLQHARHAAARGAAAVQRPISRHGHQRRRRLQPLEGPRRHALARGRHVRQLGHLLLPPRRGERRVLVRRAPADAQARATITRRSSPRRAPSSAAATATIETHTEIAVSPEDDIELRRMRITNHSRTRAHDRGDELRRGGARARRPRTRCIRRSAISSCRPRSSRQRQAILCTRRPRSPTRRRRGCST